MRSNRLSGGAVAPLRPVPTDPEAPLSPGSHDFYLDGLRLHYVVVRDGEKGRDDHVVVFLHGLLLDAELNGGVADVLSRAGCTVLLLDLLGHGGSDQPTHASQYRMDLWVDQVFALLDHVGVSRAVLGGISLGANVSLAAAVSNPERVEGLILEMPVLEWAAPVAALTFVPLTLLFHYGRGFARVLSATARRLPRSRFGPVNSLVHAVARPPKATAAILHGILLGPVAPTHDERSSIEVATLVVGHRFDLLHPLDDACNLTRQMPNAELLSLSPIKLRARPDRYSKDFAAFLREVWEENGAREGSHIGRHGDREPSKASTQ